LLQLIKFESLLIKGKFGLVGRNEVIMSEHAVSQGMNPVTATRPSDGVIAAGPMARKTVSADSFRKLTAFLKKEISIPELLPIPAPIVVAPVSVEAAVVAAPEPVFIEPPPVEPQEIELVSEPVMEPEPEIIHDLPEHVLEAAPQDIPEPILEVAPVAEIAVEIVAVEEPVPVPVKPTSSILRTRPRDAFAVSPSALPPKKPAAPTIVQTHEQEQEAAELARSLLDMMASGASSGLPQERALAADTLLRMLPRLPLKSMIMLAERLCIMEAPPHLLVAKLICDPRIEVAGPLLEECMHITDEDLALVIVEGLPAKLRMMARRRRISRAITGQLVNTGNASVLLTLARNANAEIPHESFADLVHAAAEHAELLAPLCIRADLPVPFAFELFWPAPAQLRRYLLSRFLTDSETLTKILKIARDTNGNDDSAKSEFPDPERIKDALQMAADGKHDEAATMLSEAAQINFATAARILNDKQGDPWPHCLRRSVCRGWL
jgi:uncharacterized protein (DUF2336 family)